MDSFKYLKLPQGVQNVSSDWGSLLSGFLPLHFHNVPSAAWAAPTKVECSLRSVIATDKLVRRPVSPLLCLRWCVEWSGALRQRTICLYTHCQLISVSASRKIQRRVPHTYSRKRCHSPPLPSPPSKIRWPARSKKHLQPTSSKLDLLSASRASDWYSSWPIANKLGTV